jgi:hypothetical protein
MTIPANRIPHLVLTLLLAPAVMLALSGGAFAQTTERPPSYAAAKIRGIKPAGVNYAIKNPVSSDGLFRVYTLATPYGQFTVQGDQMLRMRLNELAALAELEKLSQSEQYTRALLNAGISPVKYAGKLITNPVGTIQNTFAGVGSFFGSIGSGIANAGKTQDDTLSSLIGVTRERRQLAAKIGVDPYTDFDPLAAKLKQLSEAAALGGLTVSGAMMAIPGAAGIVVSNLSTANTLGDMHLEELARNYTASQLLDLNRKRLTAMGVDGDLVEAFLANRLYTPIDQTAITAALESMRGVADKAVFVRRAATANSRGIAFAMRKHAEMAARHARTAGFARFVSLGGFPFNQTRDGTVVGVLPVDSVSWTDRIARAFGDSSRDLKRIGRTGELRLTGTATGLAKRRLQELGWRVVENAPI